VSRAFAYGPFERHRGLLHVPAAVRGRVRWQTLDERGTPEVPRNASGFPIGPIEGIAQPNLITNLGMDGIAVTNPFGHIPIDGGNVVLRATLEVGTGSTAPAFTDTALDNPVQQGNASTPFATGSITSGLDTGTNEWFGDALCTKTITMTADRNLTEFGLSRNYTRSLGAADLDIRELLRDSIGDPTTVSLLTGKMIRVDHTFEWRMPAPAGGVVTTLDVDHYDASDAFTHTDTFDVTYGFFAETPATVGRVMTQIGGEALFNLWLASSGASGLNANTVRVLVNRRAYSRTMALTAGSTDVLPATNTAGYAATSTQSAYTPGSYTRTSYWTVPAANGNRSWLGFVLNGGNVTTHGFYCVFSDPQEYTKVDTDTMRFGLVSTWARG
jgi:hypothetical protein